jgi:hypothetical protein
VFFDRLGIEWEYEPEGFDLDGLWYLPDFRIDGSTDPWYIEIKPAGKMTDEETQKAERFGQNVGHLIVLRGVPTPPTSKDPQIHFEVVTSNDPKETAWSNVTGSTGIAFLHPITKSPSIPYFSDFRPYTWHQRTEDGSFIMWPIPANEPTGEYVLDSEIDDNVVNAAWGRGEHFSDISKDGKWMVGRDPLKAKTKGINSPALLAAYAAARGARFEHGETP